MLNDVILNTPVPTIVALVIAIAALAGYWYFVLPLIAEVKELRDSVKKYKSGEDSDITSRLSELLTTSKEFNDTLLRLREDVEKNPDSALERLQEEFNKMKLDERSSLSEIKAAVLAILEYSRTSQVRDESFHQLLTELIRHMQASSDKQSQIIGALCGMSRINTSNRSL